MAGFPTNHLGVRDLLFLNEGNGPDGRARFREVGRQVGLDPAPYDHSLGAVFTDVNGDGRPDLYVANDEDPNRLYLNEPGGPLGFHFVERARSAAASPTRTPAWAIAAADYTATAEPTSSSRNSRGQTHAVYRQPGGRAFADARRRSPPRSARTSPAGATRGSTSNNDGRLDLVLANGDDPGHEPGEGRAAGPGARARGRATSSTHGARRRDELRA